MTETEFNTALRDAITKVDKQRVIDAWNAHRAKPPAPSEPLAHTPVTEDKPKRKPRAPKARA